MPFDERAYQYVSTYLQDLVHQKTAYLLVISGDAYGKSIRSLLSGSGYSACECSRNQLSGKSFRSSQGWRHVNPPDSCANTEKSPRCTGRLSVGPFLPWLQMDTTWSLFNDLVVCMNVLRSERLLWSMELRDDCESLPALPLKRPMLDLYQELATSMIGYW